MTTQDQPEENPEPKTNHDGHRNLKTIIEQFQDYMAPKLDTYEQAIYLYAFRHSRLLDSDEITIGFKSARRKMAFGVGEAGKPMSQDTCYRKLQSLRLKGCIDILGTVHDGTRIRVRLPSEIPDMIPLEAPADTLPLEERDFFNVPENRLAILQREGNRCFYCLCDLGRGNYVIEHVVSRPEGDNSYRNVVAACRTCNNRKGNMLVEDFVRLLYREGYLAAEELAARMEALHRLRLGSLRPSRE